MTTPYHFISANKNKTYLFLAVFIFLFTGFFYLIGKYFDNPGYYLFLGLTISLSSTFFSYFYSDKVILWTTQARPATKKEFFHFYTVVENLCLAQGLPMPKLYVIDTTAMNAFATGRNPKNAVICATTGLLEKLDRSDIEGVVAHELSHIKNYDILLSSIVAVIVGALSIISDFILRHFWWRKRDDEDRNQSPIMIIVFFIVLIITPIIATLIQLAISRKREFLADASGVLMTRNPRGLISALEKISSFSKVETATFSTAHLFIANPLREKDNFSWLVNLFSTHPPIEERIKILRKME